MYHLKVCAGLDLLEVQLTATTSPTLFIDLPPYIFGLSMGNTAIIQIGKHVICPYASASDVSVKQWILGMK